MRLPKTSGRWDHIFGGPSKTTLLKTSGRMGIAIFIIFVGVAVFAILNHDAYIPSDILDQPQVVGEMSYGDGTLFMTPIESRIEDGKILIPVRTVVEKKLVRFEYMDGSQPLPILAYITPTGRLITAVSLCKPCGATRYYIKNERIACNTCNSKWDPETLIGVAGGCRGYPPELLPSHVQDGQVVIDESLVKGWIPQA